MGLEWFLFFAFLCRVCILLVFLHSFFSCLFFALFLFPLIFFFVFLRLFLFFVFLCFFVSFYSSQESLVFSAHFQAVAVDCLSVFGYGETAKTPRKREFRSDPVYTNPVRNFPSDAPFARLRPNDPSSGLTNDMREDPITESHRPIAKNKSQNLFWCNVSAQHSKIHYFRIFWWM